MWVPKANRLCCSGLFIVSGVHLGIFWNRYMSIDLQIRGKAIPLQAWTGPEGSRRLRLPDFKIVGTWRW